MLVQSVELLGGPLDGTVFEGAEAKKLAKVFSDRVVCCLDGRWYCYSDARKGRVYLSYVGTQEPKGSK